ncbi:hypothetical protein LBBP_00770 [Leptospira borgpetersenii serovar Ballum]|uniref:Uncharacterized protein n=1 Tax=Leptospira borgpetersenii serovar Ballum TaxID=280505 RepID=A0A0S2IN47_LEPBO|nr:hypothetical protein LBBP_00770 [Leptospira borgpetersenii serovar Ballum]
MILDKTNRSVTIFIFAKVFLQIVNSCESYLDVKFRIL